MNGFNSRLTVAALMALVSHATYAHDACLPLTNHHSGDLVADWWKDRRLTAHAEHARLVTEVLNGDEGPVKIPEEFVFAGHAMDTGEGQVLHLRAYDAGLKGTFGTESLHEVSIQLPVTVGKGDVMQLNTASAQLFFTAGFPDRMDMCLAYAESGEVEVYGIRSVQGRHGESLAFSGLPAGDYLWALVTANLRGVHGVTGEHDACSRPCALRLDMFFRLRDAD